MIDFWIVFLGLFLLAVIVGLIAHALRDRP